MSTEPASIVGRDGLPRPPWWHHAGMRLMAALAPGWRRYDEIHRRTQYDRALLQEVQAARLRDVLQLDGSAAKVGDPLEMLADRPVLTKLELIDRADGLHTGRVDPVDVLRVRTSGTTGEPVTIEHSDSYLAENVATKLRVLDAYGLTPGFRMLRVTCDRRHELVSFSPQPAHVLELQLRINVSKLEPDNADFVGRLCHEFAPEVVWGQPMEMLVAGKQIRSGLLRLPKVRMVWTHGDTVDRQARAALQAVFHAHHRDLYGLQEVGHLAWECPEAPGEYHLNEERTLVERAPDGALLLTSLIDTAMLIVRYRPEDRAGVIEDGCRCGRQLRRLTRIEGRQRGFLIDRAGNPMNVKPLRHRLDALPLLRWQVRQERAGAIQVAIVPDRSHPGALDPEQLAAQYRSLLNLATADVRVVSLEELMTDRGKARQFDLFTTQRELAGELL